MLKKIRKLASPRKMILGILGLLIFALLYLMNDWQNEYLDGKLEQRNTLHFSESNCHRNKINNIQINNFKKKADPANMQTRQRALVFLRTGHTQLGHDIILLIESVRFKFHTQIGPIGSLPVLIDDNKGRYEIIIFEDAEIYFSLHQWNRQTLDDYCLKYDVGVIFFMRPSKQGRNVLSFQQMGNFPIKYSSSAKLINYELNATASILRIARPGSIWEDCLQYDWTVFEPGHSSFQAVSFAVKATDDELSGCSRKPGRSKRKARKSRRGRGIFASFDSLGDFLVDSDSQSSNNQRKKLATVIHDTGQFDGIHRLIFGSGLKFWLHKVLLLDAIGYLSHGRLSLPLEKFIQIDIDDIFVGSKGHRMNADDVEALVSFQNELRKSIPGFTYQLGFSGKFIFSGTETETEGDRLFLKVHHNFQWFPHMWSHMQAHWFNNATELCKYMDINRRFAVRWHFNTSSRYAVSPHHAGVYPVHEQLYECWRKVWNITTTSTEEYPHLRPDHKRRGFIYKGVKVMPRQTCGLFTHTMVLKDYPGGPEVLNDLISGGNVFLAILYNQINIFMTHLSNYGNDRLGIYTFDRLVKFLECWTNLRLLQVSPQEMARKYFSFYPDDVDPIWIDPCLDKRHLEIWSKKKLCNQLPNFVVVGPQKTGTTALYWFLNMHPDVKSNRPSETTFEEIQFFSGKNYYKGIDWYMDFFPVPGNNTILFEKSATYFDQEIVGKRLSSLLPNRHIVVVLIDPSKRAYSWYQHMRSHNDKTALRYSFFDIVRARRNGSPPALISLQRRCLDPGFYADLLEDWMEYIKPEYIVIVDGELLKTNPALAMKNLQVDLSFEKLIDYSSMLKFDEKKGFFCQVLESGKTKCLGKSKGRKYPDMDQQSKEFLANYYSEANIKLVKLLRSMNKPIPIWLKEATNSQ